MTVKQFVVKYIHDANRIAVAYNVPTLVTLAQAAWESGWGRSAPRYNFFGMTAGPNYSGKIQELVTYEYINGVKTKVVRKFRAYDNATQAFADYAYNLATKDQFQQAFQWKHKPEEFLKHVASNGYATDPNYYNNVMKIMNMIKRYVI